MEEENKKDEFALDDEARDVFGDIDTDSVGGGLADARISDEEARKAAEKAAHEAEMKKKYPNLRRGEDRYKFTDEDRKKGARAAAEAHKRKKSFKQAMEEFLSKPAKDKNGNEIEGMTILDAMVAAQVKEALSGNTKAFIACRDTSGEMPVTKIEATSTISEEDQKSIEDSLYESYKARIGAMGTGE